MEAEPRAAPRRRDTRPFVAAAVVMLLAVAAAGSGALRGSNEVAAKRNGWIIPAAVSVVGLVALIGAVTIVYAMWPSSQWRAAREPRERAGRGVWILAAAVFAAIVLAAFALLVLTGRHRKPLPEATPTTTLRAAPAAPSAAEPARHTEPVHLVWWLAIGSIIVAGGLSTALALASRGRKAMPLPAAIPQPSPVGREAVEASIDALQREPDARLAVIAAFTAMEATLAKLGVPRPPWETPFEYVDRILMELGATAGTAAQLAELFEEAKFSSHPVDSDHKAAALEALARLRRELVRAP